MALIFATSTCAICGQRLDRPYTATSGVAFPETHPLWRYCDAPLHWDCLERWPAREVFSRGYYASARERYVWMQTLLAEGDVWLLGCGPSRETPLPEGFIKPLSNDLPSYAEVRLTDWPFRLYSEWNRWDEFVEGGYRDGLFGAALAAADQVMADVCDYAPDLKCLERLRRNAG